MANVRTEIDYFKHDPFVKGASYKWGEYAGVVDIGSKAFAFKSGQTDGDGRDLCNFIGCHQVDQIEYLIKCFNRSDEMMPESEVEWILEAHNEGMTWQQLADKYRMTVRCLKRKIGYR